MQTSINHSRVYKHTCQVKIKLILISLITKGLDVQRRN